MAGLIVSGEDGLAEYLRVRLVERGHASAAAFVRVTDPTREAFTAHVDEVVAMAGTLPPGATVISVVTRHSGKLLTRYKRAAREAKVAHGVEGVRSIGIATDEVRDPTRTGMNPIDPEFHARLFPSSVDPELVVLAVEVMLGAADRLVCATAPRRAPRSDLRSHPLAANVWRSSRRSRTCQPRTSCSRRA